MKHLDLFSGIGGFALAARNVGWQTIGFCEIDPFCISVIERRFDSVRWFSLPRHLTGGQASGADGLEQLSGIRPDWIVIENSFHRWRAWVPELRLELYRLGYASVPFRLSAADVGAAHRRARCWLVANPDSEQLRELSRWWHGPGREVAKELAQSWDSAPRGLGAAHVFPDWVDRRRALGNAIVPAAAELIFRGIEAVTYRALLEGDSSR